MKKVSVIVCSYNAADDLAECLRSLDEQDYPEKEIVVVNDASTDNTEEVLDSFKRSSTANTVVVRNEKNLGVAGSRNTGIVRSTGDIIAFTDSDCIADVKWISEMVDIYDAHKPAAVGGRIIDARMDNIWKLSSKGLNYVSSHEGGVDYIQGCNMSFDSTILRQYMFNDEIKYGYEETLLCDYLIADGHDIYYSPRAVVQHKHKADLYSLLRQKYLRGLSSVWYRKKQDKFFILKRHLVLLLAFIALPLALINSLFYYASISLFAIVAAGLLRDEFIFGRKKTAEIAVTMPFIIFIEFFHFFGACAGLLKFRLFNQSAA